MKIRYRLAAATALLFSLIFFALPALAYENPVPFCDDRGIEAPMGDPFVMKYNGVYYCYVSGGSCFSSTDMLNWQSHGTVFEGENSYNLYAPEVFHWNGAFYCLSCPSGTTNYLFKSTSPTGPFTAVTGALGGGIDGSIFRDDNGDIWFTHAEWNGISLNSLATPDDEPLHITNLPVSMSGMWTEGASIFKRNGVYYMTYTGNHVLDSSYRVSYAMSDSVVSGWTMPEQNILLLRTEGETSSLGHNSVVIGPDLDTYYIVYHNRYPYSMRGIDRAFNMQAIRWNNEKPVTCVHSDEAEDPAPPAFSYRPEEGVTTLAERVLSDDATQAVYTAEINLVPVETDALFAWQDEQNYCRLSFTENEVILAKVQAGEITEQRCSIPHGTSLDVLQCLRIQQTADTLSIYLEGGLLMQTAPTAGGRIGSGGGQVGYMAFSNKALGNLDHLAEKYPCATWDAVLANNQDQLAHVDAQEPGKAVLLSAGESACFDLRAARSMPITLSLRGCATEGTSVRVLINDQPAAEVALPVSAAYRTQAFRGLTLPEGVSRITVEVLGGSFEFYELATAEETTVTSYTADFEQIAQGMELHEGSYRRDNGKLRLYAVDSNRGHIVAKMVLGSRNWSDYSVQTTLYLPDGGETAEAGLFIRSANDSNLQASSFNFQRRWYQQCYFVGLSKGRIALYKQNYNEVLLAECATDADLTQDHTLRVTAQDEVLTVYLDGECVLQYADHNHPFLNGRCGLKVLDGEAYYDDLTVEPLPAALQ